MVRSIISMAIVFILLIAVAIYETDFVSRQFNEFSVALEMLYDKVETETAVKDDVIAVQNNWIKKKEVLHVFIPHNDIKEVDLWLSESVSLVQDKKWEDALSKVEVLKELAEQIPKNFVVSLENIL